MPEHELQYLVNEITKRNAERRRPWDIVKVLVAVAGFSGTIFAAGILSNKFEELEQFKVERGMQIDRHEISIQLLQAEKNERRRIYNDTVGSHR